MGPIRAPYRISHINRPSHIMHIKLNRFGTDASLSTLTMISLQERCQMCRIVVPFRSVS